MEYKQVKNVIEIYLDIYNDMSFCNVHSCLYQNMERCQCGIVNGITPHDMLNCSKYLTFSEVKLGKRRKEATDMSL